MTQLDPILEARVDLLQQALAEVDKIRDAMSEQRSALANMDVFLGATGEFAELTRAISLDLRDTVNRLEPEWDELDLTAAGPMEKSDDQNKLNQALGLVQDALGQLKKLEQGRKSARATFQGIHDWSVAGLADPQLDAAAKQYRKLVERIRTHRQPWLEYELQLLGRGEELFTAYFELLSSMAVRGFGVDEEVSKDRDQLLSLLLRPTVGQPAPRFKPPNLLTHSEHVQLGYAGWSLWVLPLIARDAALHMMKEGVFGIDIPDGYRELCGDVFSTYTLGPSYPCALIYLELDPGGKSADKASDPARGKVSDLVRAEVLLTLLPNLGTDVERPVLSKRADQLREAWVKARAAFHEQGLEVQPEVTPVEVPPEALEVVQSFLEELHRSHSEIAFEWRSLVNAEDWLEHLLADRDLPLPEGTLPVRDLLIAMWGARLDKPDRCVEIHSRAHELTSRPNLAGPGNQGRRLSRQ